ncbi:MAG: CCA tRNA nucleotidyltransferase [Alphaproteobacteria bacterium]|nr:CCA tRNA nucleotidyltransferase [Alphaproteobacteria bacterium]
MINSIQSDFINDPTSKKIMSLLNKEGDFARFVGGCVRDSLINIRTNDIDIATKHKPENIIEILSSNSIKVIPTGFDHGTVSIFTDTFNFEITTLRSDTETDGRHAKVSFTDSWEEDSKRRDFTINSIYLSPNGDIFDPNDGTLDLIKRNIVFIGDPRERIQEDYLRILRYFRFCGYYGDEDMPSSSPALKACEELSSKLVNLSPERVQSEFLRILIAPQAKKNIIAMSDAGILKVIFDKPIDFSYFSRMVDIDHKNQYDLNPILRLVSLIYLQLINCDQLKMFSFSNKQRDLISFLVNEKINFSHKMSKKDLNKNLYFYGSEVCSFKARVCWSNDPDLTNDDKWIGLLSIIKIWNKPILPIKAEDILKFGVKEGPLLGQILNEIESRWIASNFMLDRNFLLDKIKDLIK